MIRSLSLVVSLGLGLGFALGGFADPASAGRSLNGTSLDGVAAIERSGGCDDWGCGMNGTRLDGVAPPSSGIPCPKWECGSNGTSLDGVALRGCEDVICGDNGTHVDGVARLERVPGGCDDWGCGTNGTSLDGATPRAPERCDATAAPASRPAAREVVLSSGERIELR